MLMSWPGLLLTTTTTTAAAVVATAAMPAAGRSNAQTSGNTLLSQGKGD
jgi:hypothetical protein